MLIRLTLVTEEENGLKEGTRKKVGVRDNRWRVNENGCDSVGCAVEKD